MPKMDKHKFHTSTIPEPQKILSFWAIKNRFLFKWSLYKRDVCGSGVHLFSIQTLINLHAKKISGADFFDRKQEGRVEGKMQRRWFPNSHFLLLCPLSVTTWREMDLTDKLVEATYWFIKRRQLTKKST